MKKIFQNKITIFSLLFLVVNIILPAQILGACDSIETCDAELIEIYRQQDENKKRREENEAAEANLWARITTLDEEIQIKRAEIAALEEKIVALEADIAEKEALIKEKEEQIDRVLQLQQKQKKENIYLQLIISSTSISEMMQRWDAFQTITISNGELMQTYSEEKAELEARKEELEREQSSLEAAKTELETQQAEMRAMREEVIKILAELEVELDKLSTSQAEIEEQRKQFGQMAPSRNGWSDPLVSGRITTYYLEMYQYSPTPHLGMDFGGNSEGTPIYPIADGIVLAAGWYGSFGNLVSVGHNVDGTNYVSLYSHMSSIHVSVGQYVVGGSTSLGGIGNTGYSFGAHLHLELAVRDYFTVNKSIRTNTNVNPLDYIPW